MNNMFKHGLIKSERVKQAMLRVGAWFFLSDCLSRFTNKPLLCIHLFLSNLSSILIYTISLFSSSPAPLLLTLFASVLQSHMD